MGRELREKVLAGALIVYNQKGVKFTMDDLAKELKMSKKTIYTVFNGKEEIFLMAVDYLFNSIKESESEVLRDGSLSTLDKLKKLLGVFPDAYANVNFRDLALIRAKFPSVYEKVRERLETGWDPTLNLINKGIKEGSIRKNLNVQLFKSMFQASLERFFQDDFLKENGISYQTALNDVTEILVEGIKPVE